MVAGDLTPHAEDVLVVGGSNVMVGRRGGNDGVADAVAPVSGVVDELAPLPSDCRLLQSVDELPSAPMGSEVAVTVSDCPVESVVVFPAGAPPLPLPYEDSAAPNNDVFAVESSNDGALTLGFNVSAVAFQKSG